MTTQALVAPGQVKRAPRLSPWAILRNALSRNAGRAELALGAALTHGDVVRLPVPGKQVFLVTHPDDLRRVMVTNHAAYQKSFDYQILARLVGQGLLVSEGEVWLRDRRLQHPLFHGRLLERFYGVIGRCAGDLAASLVPGKELLLEQEATRFALHVIGERILSLDVRGVADDISRHLLVGQEQVVARGLALVDLAKYVPTPGELRFKRSLAKLNGIIDGFIDQRAAMTAEVDLYSVLAEESYTREQLRDQFVTLFMAGHETTAVAITWFFHALAQHPEIEARVREEAKRVVSGDVPTRPELDQLVYTRQVLNEVLRLYPPIGFMGREALADDVLGGYPIPRGAIVVICPYATHRRPDLWPDPDRFDPDRFAPGADAGRPPLAHLPYGAGPRGCIAPQFATLELLSVVGAVAKKVRLVPMDARPLRPVPLVSMRPNRPVPMRVET